MQNNLPKVAKLDEGRTMTRIRKPGRYTFAKRETACRPQSKLMWSLMVKTGMAASLPSKPK